MREVLDSVKVQISERVTNPIFLPFILSWVVLNHKVILWLLSTNSVEDKLAVLQAHFALQSPWLNGITLGIIYPGIFAAAFVFSYPFANRYLMKYWRWQIRKAKEDYVKHVDANPMSREEARENRREADRKVAESEAELDAKDRQLNSVNKKFEYLEEQLDAAQKQIEVARENKTKDGEVHRLEVSELQERIDNFIKREGELKKQSNNELKELKTREKGLIIKLTKEMHDQYLRNISLAMDEASEEARRLGFTDREMAAASLFYDKAMKAMIEPRNKAAAVVEQPRRGESKTAKLDELKNSPVLNSDARALLDSVMATQNALKLQPMSDNLKSLLEPPNQQLIKNAAKILEPFNEMHRNLDANPNHQLIKDAAKGLEPFEEFQRKMGIIPKPKE